LLFEQLATLHSAASPKIERPAQLGIVLRLKLNWRE
jgi:hypothetical protein